MSKQCEESPMFEIILLSTLIFLSVVIVGAPITLLTFCAEYEKRQIEFPFFLAISIISGFGISAFSASLAYSFFGINNYLIIFLLFGISLWALVYFSRAKLSFKLLPIKGFIFFLFTSVFLAVYFAKTQWDINQKPRIFSALGPDVSQNLLAASIAPTLGNTWGDASRGLIKSLGTNNLDEAAVKLFEIPSHVHLAGYDYLVFGVRWGLTIPFSQILKIAGPQTIMLEIGSILVVSIVSTLIIGFATLKIAKKSLLISALGAIALSFNGAFLNQYFNGGISQALGLIGNFGILMCLTILLTSKDALETKRNQLGFLAISILTWTSSAISYVDATLIIGIFVVLFALVIYRSHKTQSKDIAVFIIFPGLATLALNPIFTYAIWDNLNYRVIANLGTGINTGAWRMPTQNFGILSVYSEFTETTINVIQIFSLVILILGALAIIGNLRIRSKINFIFVGSLLTSSILIVLGFTLAKLGRNNSDYVYNKISTFLAPFVIVSFLLILNSNTGRYLKKLEYLFTWFMPIIIFGSAVAVESSFSRSTSFTTIMPNQYATLLKNSKIQEYFSQSNYILPYKVAYNFTGIFGVNYWISKAPNDMNYAIDSRLDKPLKLFCFIGENVCNPTTSKIINSETAYLEKFGIQEFESTLTTREYLALAISDRYNYVFDEMGAPRQSIPERYLGGNPYLK